jgi:hypothetical protein
MLLAAVNVDDVNQDLGRVRCHPEKFTFVLFHLFVLQNNKQFLSLRKSSMFYFEFNSVTLFFFGQMNPSCYLIVTFN